MRFLKCMAIGALTLALGAMAAAQFKGPAPLAWRWWHPTSVAPSGAPVIVGQNVYLAVGNRMFAVDRETGNQKWRYPLVEGLPGNFRSAPVLVEGVLAAAADDGVIYAVDVATGQSKWQYQSPVPIIGQPIAVGRFIVFQLTDNTLMAIRASDGQAEWRGPYRIFAGLNGGMAAHGDNFFYMTQNNELICMNVNSQQQLWVRKFTVIFGDSTPVLYGDILYVNSGQYLVALSAITGTPRWEVNVREQLTYSPAVSPTGVFVVSAEGRAFLYDPLSGRPLLKQPVVLGSTPVTRPSVADAFFVAPTANGAMNLVDATTGEIIWSYLVRPLVAFSTPSSPPGARPGGGRAGGAATGGGAAAGGSTGQQSAPPLAIPAAGPAVLVGQTLLLLVQDGSLLAFDKDMGVDKTGPTVKMLWPVPGDVVAGKPGLELIFKIEDEASGVNGKTLSITVGGKELEFEYGRDGFAIVKISNFGKNTPLSDGWKAILVTVSDFMGNRTTASYALTIDNSLPPHVTPRSQQPPGAGGRGGAGGGIGGSGIG